MSKGINKEINDLSVMRRWKKSIKNYLKTIREVRIMLTRDQLRQKYEKYLERCELDGIDEENIMSFDEYVEDYHGQI